MKELNAVLLVIRNSICGRLPTPRTVALGEQAVWARGGTYSPVGFTALLSRTYIGA
jgi:hypothetical protein